MRLILGLSKKHPCGTCLWDSYAYDQHYIRRKWPSRGEIYIGTVRMSNYYFSPYLIKRYLMEKFIDALDRKGKAFAFFFKKFKQESVEEGIFDYFRLKEIINDPIFKNMLNPLELSTCLSINAIVTSLGKFSPKMIDELLKNFHRLGILMSVKIHFLHSHLDLIPEDYDEQQQYTRIEELIRLERIITKNYHQNQFSIESLTKHYQHLKKNKKRSFSLSPLQKRKIRRSSSLSAL